MRTRSSRFHIDRAPRGAARSFLATLVLLSACSDTLIHPPDPPADLVKVAGDNQEAMVGSRLPHPLVVRVLDAGGRPVAGAEVRWNAASTTGGTVPEATRTDATGEVRAEWTLGTTAGTMEVTATIDGLTATFTADGRAGPAARITKRGGDGQSGTAGTSLPDSLAVALEDEHGNAVRGAVVRWSVNGGGGSVSPDSAVSGDDGTAKTRWTLADAAGPNSVTASVEGGLVAHFDALGTAGAPSALVRRAGDGQSGPSGMRLADSLVVEARDAQGNPVAGVAVQWTVVQGGGSASPVASSTGSDGRASTAWTLGGQSGEHRMVASADGLASVQFTSVAWGAPRIVTFGDSNFDSGWSGRAPAALARSYISAQDDGLHRGANEPNHPTQLAGKIEAEWALRNGSSITAVNHAIGGTGSGTGRHASTAPNARLAVNGTERYRAEVLGAGYPWNGGESGTRYPSGGVDRVQAFAPTPLDFVVIGLGTNDPASGVSPEQTRNNIRWMIEQWKGAGLPARNLMITTLPPGRSSGSATSRYPETNDLLRALAADEGVGLIDLAAHVSDDNGRTWRSPDLHLFGDEIHYAEQVRAWLAVQVVAALEAALHAAGPAAHAVAALSPD